MEVVVKNDTSHDVRIADLGGVTLPVSGSRDLYDIFTLTEITESDDLKTHVTSGGIIINDGVDDLSITNALKYLTGVTDKQAFDYSTTDMQFEASGEATGQYYFEITSTTYQVVRQFIFRGSDISGVPTMAKVTAWVDNASDPGVMRLYDITNDNIIAQWDNINETSETVHNTTASMIPSGEAIIEIQGKRNSTNTGLYVTAVMLGFD